MPDMTREQERNELHRAIWSMAEELRGSVGGWEFKSYVLGTMFYRYLSEKITKYINKDESDDFDYTSIPDAKVADKAFRKDLIDEIGFFMLPSELFCNVRVRAAQDDNLNETLETIFRNIEESSRGTESQKCFVGLFDDFDVNSNQLGATVQRRNERLVKLLDGVGKMRLGDICDHKIDAFGDAYEYLMTMYAANAGKSGGEFYTPAEVSLLLSKIATNKKACVRKVYDPACGSGSLLLKVKAAIGDNGDAIEYFGQEINLTSYNLCRINMFLHGIDFAKFNIVCEDTLLHPQDWGEKDKDGFDVIISNPPYSVKWEGDSNPLLINDPRFSPAGVLAPKSKADMAFIMHCLYLLSTDGVAAIVCFPGIMYRGGAEKKIRQHLVTIGVVDCVIQLPDNLFYGTSIATDILVLRKGRKDNSVLFVDASKEFVKVTNSNKLTDENINHIVQMYAERKDIPHRAHLATYDEVVKQDYNLSVSTYVEAEDTREKIDIKKLNAEIGEIVVHEQKLRIEIDRIIAEIEG